MELQSALSILSGSEKDKLAVSQGKLIEAIQKTALSAELKNKNYSGDATTGTVVIPRYISAVADNYGAARTAGKGKSLNNKGRVELRVDTDKEYVEEVENKDIALSGVSGLVESRVANQAMRMSAELDRAFFNAQEAVATEVDVASQKTVADKLEAIIQSIETTQNEYVDGVDREQIVLTLKPSAYGLIRNEIDKVSNPNIDSSREQIELWHGVRVYSNHRQTSDVLASVDGSTAQLVLINEYQAERIPMSNATAVGLFFSYGTKVVTPDLVKKATIITA